MICSAKFLEMVPEVSYLLLWVGQTRREVYVPFPAVVTSFSRFFFCPAVPEWFELLSLPCVVPLAFGLRWFTTSTFDPDAPDSVMNESCFLTVLVILNDLDCFVHSEIVSVYQLVATFFTWTTKNDPVTNHVVILWALFFSLVTNASILSEPWTLLLKR